ncbi:permease [Croceicoccus estronivorus]|uniref:sulfite exporter TauE/SafE family protein n=1 Tax=Croceicoccus estronivorus TaxID=1172626 RepID=UPI000830BD99|nr:sulfite exporter TauE/SafE family protein [Croceicoccus estronivorus]OCC24686.1 permease [Croceicoccus estronivorus]
MIDWTTAILILAGVVGGIVNAVAGGATLITFPLLLATGLPPVAANIANAIAVSPGHLLAVLADRRSLPVLDCHLYLLLLLSAAGGLAGAGLLLIIPDRLFTMPIPALIAGATLLFALAPRIARTADSRESRESRHHGAKRRETGLLALTAIYGGFFGAGLGIILTAILSLSEPHDIRRIKAVKNLLASVVAIAANLFFLLRGAVHWPSAFPMLLGAIVGGYAGGHLVRVLPANVVRGVVLTAGSVMSIVYAFKYWI